MKKYLNQSHSQTSALMNKYLQIQMPFEIERQKDRVESWERSWGLQL